MPKPWASASYVTCFSFYLTLTHFAFKKVATTHNWYVTNYTKVDPSRFLQRASRLNFHAWLLGKYVRQACYARTLKSAKVDAAKPTTQRSERTETWVLTVPSSVAQAQQVTRSAAVTLPRREEKANAQNPLRAAVTFQIQQPTKLPANALRTKAQSVLFWQICRFPFPRSPGGDARDNVFFANSQFIVQENVFTRTVNKQKNFKKLHCYVTEHVFFCFLLRYLRHLNVAYDSLRSSGSRSL